jgi:hypothetical protein
MLGFERGSGKRQEGGRERVITPLSLLLYCCVTTVLLAREIEITMYGGWSEEGGGVPGGLSGLAEVTVVGVETAAETAVAVAPTPRLPSSSSPWRSAVSCSGELEPGGVVAVVARERSDAEAELPPPPSLLQLGVITR